MGMSAVEPSCSRCGALSHDHDETVQTPVKADVLPCIAVLFTVDDRQILPVIQQMQHGGGVCNLHVKACMSKQ